MKYILIAIVVFCTSLVLAQEVTVAIEAVDLELSYIEYTGYVNERDHDFVARVNPNSLTLSYTPETFEQNFYLEITALANDFDSGNWFRDQNGRRTVFESGKFPEIKFTAEDLISGELIDETQSAILSGQLTIKDIEKEVSVPITIENQDTNLIVSGEFTVLLSDFDIKRPSALGDVVDDDILIRFQINLL